MRKQISHPTENDRITNLRMTYLRLLGISSFPNFAKQLFPLLFLPIHQIKFIEEDINRIPSTALKRCRPSFCLHNRIPWGTPSLKTKQSPASEFEPTRESSQIEACKRHKDKSKAPESKNPDFRLKLCRRLRSVLITVQSPPTHISENAYLSDATRYSHMRVMRFFEFFVFLPVTFLSVHYITRSSRHVFVECSGA
jgi:hypothetical protein